ncbi:MAG: glycosyltransferase family 4 protein [Spirochaetota bacterium]
MKKPMNIVQVSKRFVTDEWGGPEAFFAETSRRLVERGVEAKIVATTAFSDVNEEDFHGTPVIRCSYFYPYVGLSGEAKKALDRRGGDPFSFAVKQALKKQKQADLFHISMGSRLGSCVRAAARRRKIPYVISLTGEFFVFPNPRFGSTAAEPLRSDPSRGSLYWGKPLEVLCATGKVLEDASAIICSGKDDFTAVSRIFPDKRIVFLPNGVDMKRFSEGSGDWFREMYRIPRDRFVVLSVGKIEPRKNQLALVRQLPDILDKAPNVHLLCIGSITDADYHAQLLKEISLQKLEKHTTIIPGLPLPYDSYDLVNAYHAADCLVFPSLYESFGMPILEAWAAGLPVAATKRGGPAYLIRHGENGLLFDPEAPARFEQSLKTAVISLALDREARQSYAAAGHREAFERYSWEMITDRLLSLYDEVITDFSS